MLNGTRLVCKYLTWILTWIHINLLSIWFVKWEPVLDCFTKEESFILFAALLYSTGRPPYPQGFRHPTDMETSDMEECYIDTAFHPPLRSTFVYCSHVAAWVPLAQRFSIPKELDVQATILHATERLTGSRNCLSLADLHMRRTECICNWGMGG